MSTERELQPDERLRAALRHAPDADVQAPHAIGERLLAEARRAVMPAAPLPAEPWWRRWFATGTWLPQGALASLLIAGLVTLLWQHEEAPGPTVAARAPEAAEAAAPAQPASTTPAVVLAEAAAPTPRPASPAPARVAKAAPAPEPRAAAEATAEPVVAATAPAPAADAAKVAAAPAPAPAADNTVVAEAWPVAPPPAAAPAAAAAPSTLQRLRAPVQVGALRAAASAAPLPPWDTAAPVPPALAELAGRVTGPWIDAVQPAGQPLVAWQHEGSLLGRAWLERRGQAEWLVWCGATAATCREAPLGK